MTWSPWAADGYAPSLSRETSLNHSTPSSSSMGACSGCSRGRRRDARGRIRVGCRLTAAGRDVSCERELTVHRCRPPFPSVINSRRWPRLTWPSAARALRNVAARRRAWPRPRPISPRAQRAQQSQTCADTSLVLTVRDTRPEDALEVTQLDHAPQTQSGAKTAKLDGSARHKAVSR